MKSPDPHAAFMGISAAASLIGLTLLGLCFGASLRADTAATMTTHALLIPGLVCVAAGSLNLLLLSTLTRPAGQGDG